MYFQKKSKITLKTKLLGVNGPVKGYRYYSRERKDTDQPVHVHVVLFWLPKQWNNMSKE